MSGCSTAECSRVRVFSSWNRGTCTSRGLRAVPAAARKGGELCGGDAGRAAVEGHRRGEDDEGSLPLLLRA